ncbi:uncharacterized protein LOC118673010 isoform X1 [Myotis myotis]|uniref:uncharacterized protein LOC118673010 isoform X1 n=1 Tax=Myotis myotis TaxID=51298 RepID=UPI001749F6A5|nr:uncharacterized protein LOC118673010 isoform X1 [Myotis myotis]
MASASTSKMREEATCSICLHLMAEPVSISCGHSYCQVCLLGFMSLSSSSQQSQRDTPTFSSPGSQQSTFSSPGSQQSTFSSPGSQQSTFSSPGSQQSTFSFPGSQQSTFSFPGSQQSTFSFPRSQQSTFSFPGSQQSTFSFLRSQQSTFSFPGSQQSTFSSPGSQQSTFSFPRSQQSTFSFPGSQQSTFSFPRSQQDTQTFSCPQCRAPFQRGSLRPNKQLGSLIAALREQEQQQQQLEQELSCQEHGERLHLFCEDEGQLICWRCERDGRHKGHNTAIVEDVGPGYREKLQEAVRKLRKLEEECTNQKAFTVKQMAEWKEKVEAQRQKIQAGFQNLHSFLREEERSFLWRLESEEERTLQRLRVSEADLDQQSRQLESHIRELEERCQGSVQKLLQDVKGALSRSQAVRLEMPEALSLEIETECEVPELYFDLSKHLRSHQEQPGSCETDMEQFAETLSGRVTTDEALEELVDLIYQQATSERKFRCGGTRLCAYLSRHLTIHSQRGSFRQVLLQRCQADYEPRDQAAKGDEAARKRFLGFVLFLGELYLPLEIEGANTEARVAALRGLLEALLSHPVDDNLICAVKFLRLTGPALEDVWKGKGRTDMDEVIQRIGNVALDVPCSEGMRHMLLTLVELRSSVWGRGPVTSASERSST